MKNRWFDNIWVRNLAGFLALLGVHYVSDQYNIGSRSGFNQASPYLFLISLYGWIVFHNRILFERLYRKGKRSAYFGWTFLAITVSSLNMHFILRNAFHVEHTLPHIISFLVYTITGLGVYVIYKYLHAGDKNLDSAISQQQSKVQPAFFNCHVDGEKMEIPCGNILFVESLENYVKVITNQKSYVVRISLKDAEDRLPKPDFVRISRSHIVNTAHIVSNGNDSVKVRNQDLKIGKVYKKYVAEQLSSIRQRGLKN